MATLTNKELFCDGFLKVLKEQQLDVQLKAQNSNKKSIPAHKLILSARSEVLKKMLESEQCKASSKSKTITLSDMKHAELEVFVEFIYSDGSMLSEKAKQHVWSLYRAAGKYEIPHLRDLCRNELKLYLDLPNALDVLELAQEPLDNALKQAALDFIRMNITNIASSDTFKLFVAKNPDLTVEIVNTSFNRGSNNARSYCLTCRRY